MASEVVVNEFVAEARDHLNDTERDLLLMENGPGSCPPDTINGVFRAIHSIKGASGTFGFHAVMDLSHAMESVLLRFRDGATLPDHEKISELLHGVDKLRFMVDDIYSSNEVDCSYEISRLNAILQDEEKKPGPEPSVAAPFSQQQGEAPAKLRVADPSGSGVIFEADREQIASAVAMCHSICVVCAHSDADLEQKQRTLDDFLQRLETLGQCLATESGNCPALQSKPLQPHLLHFLFATVLEPDLIGTALDIADEQIHVADPEFLQRLLQGDMVPSPPDPVTVSQPAVSEQAEKKKSSGPETIRVHIGLLDTLINLAGELVLGRNQLRQILDATVDTNPRLRTVIQSVNLVTSEMQEHILQMRMQPINNILNRIHRLVRDLAHQLSKEVELVTEGGDVELDKSILEGLIDPLVHIIRNCVDHGIETPAERIAAGKPPRSEIRLRASHEGGQVNITISDDGRGMDLGKIVEKAMAQGNSMFRRCTGG